MSPRLSLGPSRRLIPPYMIIRERDTPLFCTQPCFWQKVQTGNTILQIPWDRTLPQSWKKRNEVPHMKVKFYTLGCKVNQYETEAMREALAAQGFPPAGEDGPARPCAA